MIQTSVQFYGLSSDDPNAHITSFLEIYDTFKHNGVIDDAIPLGYFCFLFKTEQRIGKLHVCRLNHQLGRFSSEMPCQIFPAS